MTPVLLSSTLPELIHNFSPVEKKFAKFDEVIKLIGEALKEPEHTGTYHDYIELCKLYDKNENGTIMLAELEMFLSSMGKFLISMGKFLLG